MQQTLCLSNLPQAIKQKTDVACFSSLGRYTSKLHLTLYGIIKTRHMKKATILITTLFLFVFANAQPDHLLKSVFMYNFGTLIEWPASYKSGQFIIGVYGNTPTYNELVKMASQKKIGSQSITVKKISSVSEAGSCHMVLISPEKAGETSSMQSAIGSKSTLIITDKPGAAKSGAGISFTKVSSKIRFELNKANCSKQNLKVSSNLEKLAIIVN